MSRLDLASNAAAGTSSPLTWPGGKGIFAATANWGGGNAKLQMQLPDNNWVDVTGTTLTANGYAAIDLPAGQLRSVTATGSAFYCWAIQNP